MSTRLVPARPESRAPDVPLLVSLYALEATALLLVLAAHRRGARPFAALPLVAGLALLVSIAVIVQRTRVLVGRDPRRLAFTAMLNLVPVLLVVATGELTVRLLARPTPRGPVVMNTHLLPWRWTDVVAHNEAILERAAREGSYLVADERLGWVVGPSRRSANGLYFSSAEGLRSPAPGIAFRERTAASSYRPRRRFLHLRPGGRVRGLVGAPARAGARSRRPGPQLRGRRLRGRSGLPAIRARCSALASGRGDPRAHQPRSVPIAGRVQLRQLPGLALPLREAALRGRWRPARPAERALALAAIDPGRALDS